MSGLINGYAPPQDLTDVTTYEYVDLEVLAVVTETDDYVPLTGVHATEESIPGWIWDRRRLESTSDVKSRYDTFLGGHLVGLKEGTRLSWWQSGTTDESPYLGIARYDDGNFNTWTPLVTPGRYSLYFDERDLYSDCSFSDVFDTTLNENGVNVYALPEEGIIESTISVTLYTRTSELLIFKKISAEYVETFTGEISGGARLATEDEDEEIIWANLETRKQEFVIRDDTVYLNNDYSIVVGGDTVAIDSLPAVFEYKGIGNENGRTLFTNYFPLQDSSVSLLVSNGVTFEEWTEVDTLNHSGPTDKHYSVDHDYGIIRVGGHQAEPLFLSEAITDIATTVPILPDIETFADYPDYGIIEIGTEQILYEEKGEFSFLRCTRGYDGTTAAGYALGTELQDIQHGLATAETDTLYLGYTAVPRIEFETVSYEERSANSASGWLDIKPAKNTRTNNILQISSSQSNLDSIVLETDSELIGGNLYGPVYYGTDVSRLTATAYDANGNTVDGIELTIEILSGPGTLNSSGVTLSRLTNTLGEMYGYYSAPYDDDSINHEVLSVSYDGADTHFEVADLPAEADLDKLTVFQILKHDKSIGTYGLKSSVVTSAAGDADRGVFVVTINHLIDKEYEGGLIKILGTDATNYYRTITKIYQTTSGGMPVSLVYVDEALTSLLIDGQVCWLLEQDVDEWDSSLLNGMKVLLYEWRADIPHPITEALGAYYPVRPDSLSGDILVFESKTLTTPLPDDVDSNLGGYVVIGPSIATVQAYGRDPASGMLVWSNKIRLSIDIPNFLSGVDHSGALPIPYGFTFITEEFNVGAGIGGSNFLTVNPKAEGINQFSLRIEA